MKITHKIVWNRYFIVLMIFAAWMLFFDQNNLFRQLGLYNDLKTAEQQKEYYINAYKNDSIFLEQLRNDPDIRERFAREEYMMKKDDEIVFRIIRE